MKSSRVVVNASPIITLSRVGAVDLLWKLFDEVVIPEGVVTEINAGDSADPAVIWLSTQTECSVYKVVVADCVFEWNLGLGESEVISYAYASASPCHVSIDDRAAKRCAETLGLPVIGTIGLLISAKRRGIIPSVTELLHQILANGFRLSDSVVEKALILAGE